MAQLNKLASECRILIVDDECGVRDLLSSALGGRYKVTACGSGSKAREHFDAGDFDVVITDLRLPDGSGIDILGFAKSKDPYIEVLLITGHASLETASIAINMGASSYTEKPLSLPDFLIQVEKAVASRIFHLKSITLMRKTDALAPEFKDHFSDLTELYYFARKLTLSLEVAEIMRITLEEACRKSGALLCAIGIQALGFTEMYAMPSWGEIDPSAAKALLLRNWETTFPFIAKEGFAAGAPPLVLYKGKHGAGPRFDGVRPVSIPMMVTGTSIGMLVIARADRAMFKAKHDGKNTVTVSTEVL